MNDFLHSQIPRLMPVPVLVFLAVFFVFYAMTQMPARGTAEWVEFARRKGTARGLRRGRMGRPDWITMAAVTAVYAAVTFFYLGDMKAPASFYRFEHGSEPLVITLDEPAELSRMQYYCGLNLNNHQGKTLLLEASADGVEWVKLSDITRNYANTFRWQEAGNAIAAFGPIQALRLYTDGTGLDVGEIALRDKYDNLIPASRLTVSRAGEPDKLTAKMSKRSAQDPRAVLDEQDVVPVRRSIMNSTHFDEIYHAYTAYEHMEGWYPYENTHPPLGKLTTLLGIRMFGMTPFGWRFMPALFGVLMLPFLYVLIQNMFGKTLVSLCGTALFAFDFMHFVQTRISTIDVYAVFYIILMYLFMYRWLTLDPKTGFLRTVPDLALCGLSFGLGAASKWTCIYAALGLIALYIWGMLRRRAACRPDSKQDRARFWRFFYKTIGVSILSFVLIPGAIYVTCYIPYNVGRDLTPANVWKACWSNQTSMVNYHSKLGQKTVKAPSDGLVSAVLFPKGASIRKGENYLVYTDAQGNQQSLSAEEDCRVLRVQKQAGKSAKEGETLLTLSTGGHPYASRWYQWLVNHRPVYFYAGDYTKEVPVTAPVSGVVREIFFWNNDDYETGDALMTLDSPGGQTVTVSAQCDSHVLRLMTEPGAQVSEGGVLLYEAGTYMRSSASTFNNPIVVWGGLIAILTVLLMTLVQGYKVGWFILIGYLSQLAPWMGIERTTYAYHYFPSMIFCVLALCFVFDTYLDRAPSAAAETAAPPKASAKPAGKNSKSKSTGISGAALRKLPPPRTMILVFTGIAVALFALFYPVLSGYPVPNGFVKTFLRWLGTWPV